MLNVMKQAMGRALLHGMGQQLLHGCSRVAGQAFETGGGAACGRRCERRHSWGRPAWARSLAMLYGTPSSSTLLGRSSIELLRCRPVSCITAVASESVAVMITHSCFWHPAILQHHVSRCRSSNHLGAQLQRPHASMQQLTTSVWIQGRLHRNCRLHCHGGAACHSVARDAQLYWMTGSARCSRCRTDSSVAEGAGREPEWEARRLKAARRC